MPLIQIQKINQDTSWSLWHIQEDSQKLLEMLSLPEQAGIYWEEISHEARKCEAIASRLALKALLAQQAIPYLGIEKDDCQKPFLINQSYHISLSHTQDYAVAILNTQMSTGIDIEWVKPKVRKIARKFLSITELDDAREDIEKLTVYWAAKEALYKLYGRKKIIFRENIHIKPFLLGVQGELTGVLQIPNLPIQYYQLRYQKLENRYVCYVCKSLTGEAVQKHNLLT